jgi:hypothetical protein
MENCGRIEAQITKVKIGVDKAGKKYAVVELTQTWLPDTWREDAIVARAINYLLARTEFESIRLQITLDDRRLEFLDEGAVAWEIPCCRLENFRLKRIGDRTKLSFEFAVSLAEAKHWLIPAVGDTVNVRITHSQMRMAFAEEREAVGSRQ